MLSTIGKAFFEVATISRAKGDYIPTIYLNIRNSETGKMLGQMRFNKDEHYSPYYIRMAFNLMEPNLINPEMGGKDLLEEITIGGLIWLSMDNHYLIPDKRVLPYMVVHDYAENSPVLNMINAQTRAILIQYGCEQEANDMFVFDPKRGGQMLSEFLKRKQQ